MDEDDDQEDQAHGREHDDQGQDEAEELAEEELGPADGLGEQGEDRPLFDLLVDQPGPDQDGHQRAEEGDRGQARRP